MPSSHWERLATELSVWQQEGRRPALWWRDDDAIAPTDALRQLLVTSQDAGVPLVLAVIPSLCDPSLPQALAAYGGVRVAPHGWAHTNHQPLTSKKAELGEARDIDLVLTDVRRGWDLVSAAFGDLALPLAVPPWNRFHPELPARLASAGVAALSGFGGRPEASPVPRVDTHIDLIAWKEGRGFIGEANALERLIDALTKARLDRSGEPLGILSHHLVEIEETASFMQALAPQIRAGGGVFIAGDAILSASVGERISA